MTITESLIDEAIGLFHQRWRERRPGWFEQQACALRWLMPQLLRLAQEFGEPPSRKIMRPLVRRMVEDRDNANQFALHDSDDAILLDCYVDTLVEVVTVVRDHAAERGLWLANTPDATPIMCG